MCGRFTLHTEKDMLARRFRFELAEIEPRYNVAPTQDVWVVRAKTDPGMATPAREAQAMRWGLIPHWAKGPRDLPQMINARIETAAEKPAFRDAFASRHCFVLADGFFEWKADARGGPKVPHLIRRKDGGAFAMAGLFERWRPREGPAVTSCTILTAPANEAVAPLHDRMPIILAPDREDVWLDPGAPDEAIRRALEPLAAADLEVYPVSTRVNAATAEGRELIERHEPEPVYRTGSLF